MKLTRLLSTAFAAILFFSCQKEMSFENGLSEGSLKQDVAGVCLPSSVSGIYKEDSLLNATNYIDLQVNVSETGAYIIKSDTVNGYSFYGAGSFSAPGINNVRVTANGRPTDPGVNTFTMMYDSSACTVDVTVISIGPPGTYTLSGAGGACSGAVANGTYTAGTPMAAGNTLTLNVDVTTPGSYTITTPVVNGVSFSALGDFATAGAQTVTLNASGTPTAAGDHTYPITANSSNCNYVLTVTGPAGPAAFTLGGAGGACTGVVLAGTYQAGTPMTSTNTATINVNVITPGTYTINTTGANGVTFSRTGSFSTAGAQTVTLTASGTPTAAGTTTHTVNGTPGTCTFPVTYTSGGTPAAVYTLNGAPAACTGATTQGTYTAGTALTASNTVTINVNVTTPGTYTITTNTVNGYSFSKTGTFAATGNQPVVLNGTGTPTAAGTNSFTFTGAGPTCTFSVTVAPGTPPPPTEHLTATFGATPMTFNVDDSAFYVIPGFLIVYGFVNATTDESFAVGIENFNGSPITTGTYTMAGSGTTYQVYGEYEDPTGEFWDPSDGSVVTEDPWTITITFIDATRVAGTFTGTIRNDTGNGTQTKLVNNGSFNVFF